MSALATTHRFQRSVFVFFSIFRFGFLIRSPLVAVAIAVVVVAETTRACVWLCKYRCRVYCVLCMLVVCIYGVDDSARRQQRSFTFPQHNTFYVSLSWTFRTACACVWVYCVQISMNSINSPSLSFSVWLSGLSMCLSKWNMCVYLYLLVWISTLVVTSNPLKLFSKASEAFRRAVESPEEWTIYEIVLQLWHGFVGVCYYFVEKWYLQLTLLNCFFFLFSHDPNCECLQQRMKRPCIL